MSLPAFEVSKNHQDACRAACKALQEGGISGQKQTEQAFSYQKRHTLIAEFISGKVKKLEEQQLRILWAWLSERHPKTLAEAWAICTGKTGGVPDLVNILHAFFTPQRSLPTHTLEAMRGAMIGYRTSFINPERDVMRMVLECGIGDDPSAFRLLMAHRDVTGEHEETAVGHMVPYRNGSCILFMGRLAEKSAPFIFILSEFPNGEQSAEHPITVAKGALLVGPTENEATGWPMFFHRSHVEATAGIVDRETLERGNEISADRIFEVLDRGYVSRLNRKASSER